MLETVLKYTLQWTSNDYDIWKCSTKLDSQELNAIILARYVHESIVVEEDAVSYERWRTYDARDEL